MKNNLASKVFKKICHIYTCRQLTGLFLTVMLAMSNANPILQASLQPEKPCNVLNKGGKFVIQPKDVTMDDLIKRTMGVNDTAKRIKDFIKTEIQETNLPTFNFISKEEFTVTDKKKTKASTNFSLALKDHYKLLSKLISYTEYARTSDRIGKQHDRPETLKGKLRALEDQLYQIMCDIKIALIGQNDTAKLTVSDELVSPRFKAHAEAEYNETKRAYYLMNDCQDIMGFLKQMFTLM